MLTRLRVKGFKSLEDVEIRFGPFTCVAGSNGVGKSNLFDAIAFLQKLAEMPIMEAAAGIRNDGIASLFTRTETRQAQLMEFEADLLAGAGTRESDDSPSAAYLRYQVCLQYVPADADGPESIRLVREHLSGLPKRGLAEALGFETSRKFLSSVHQAAGAASVISSEKGEIRVRSSAAERPERHFSARHALCTALNQMDAADHPMALAARREMQTWLTLRLELSALRRPDDFAAPSTLAPDGAHLPAVLARLSSNEVIANQLAALVSDVDKIFVREDEQRQTKTLCLTSRSGVVNEAATLSDGLLRFLALAVVGADPETGALVCVEEPENGMHPPRIGTILELLKQTVVDPAYALGADNQLRQIIVNTHSPALVRNLLPEEVIICQTYRFDGVALSMFSPLQNTWRDRVDATGRCNNRAVGLGAVLAYLDGALEAPTPSTEKLNIEQEYKQQLAALASK